MCVPRIQPQHADLDADNMFALYCRLWSGPLNALETILDTTELVQHVSREQPLTRRCGSYHAVHMVTQRCIWNQRAGWARYFSTEVISGSVDLTSYVPGGVDLQPPTSSTIVANLLVQGAVTRCVTPVDTPSGVGVAIWEIADAPLSTNLELKSSYGHLICYVAHHLNREIETGDVWLDVNKAPSAFICAGVLDLPDALRNNIVSFIEQSMGVIDRIQPVSDPLDLPEERRIFNSRLLELCGDIESNPGPGVLFGVQLTPDQIDILENGSRASRRLLRWQVRNEHDLDVRNYRPGRVIQRVAFRDDTKVDIISSRRRATNDWRLSYTRDFWNEDHTATGVMDGVKNELRDTIGDVFRQHIDVLPNRFRQVFNECVHDIPRNLSTGILEACEDLLGGFGVSRLSDVLRGCFCIPPSLVVAPLTILVCHLMHTMKVSAPVQTMVRMAIGPICIALGCQDLIGHFKVSLQHSANGPGDDFVTTLSNIATVMYCCVTFKTMPSKGDRDSIASRVKELAASVKGVSNLKRDMSSLLESCIDLLRGFIDGVASMAGYPSMSARMFGGVKYVEVLETGEEWLRHGTGSPDTLIPVGQQIAADLRNAVDKDQKVIDKCTMSIILSLYNRICARLVALSSSFCADDYIEPVGFHLSGPPGLGKTFMLNLIVTNGVIALLPSELRRRIQPILKNLICSCDPASNFGDPITPRTMGLIMDETTTVPSECLKSQTMLRSLLGLISPNPTPLNMAFDKGMTASSLKIIGLAGNSSDGLRTVFEKVDGDKGAYYRRLLDVEYGVSPEYLTNGRLDKDKVRGKLPDDYAIFRLFRWVVPENAPASHERHHVRDVSFNELIHILCDTYHDNVRSTNERLRISQAVFNTVLEFDEPPMIATFNPTSGDPDTGSDVSDNDFVDTETGIDGHVETVLEFCRTRESKRYERLSSLPSFVVLDSECWRDVVDRVVAASTAPCALVRAECARAYDFLISCMQLTSTESLRVQYLSFVEWGKCNLKVGIDVIVNFISNHKIAVAIGCVVSGAILPLFSGISVVQGPQCPKTEDIRDSMTPLVVRARICSNCGHGSHLRDDCPIPSSGWTYFVIRGAQGDFVYRSKSLDQIRPLGDSDEHVSDTLKAGTMKATFFITKSHTNVMLGRPPRHVAERMATPLRNTYLMFFKDSRGTEVPIGAIVFRIGYQAYVLTHYKSMFMMVPEVHFRPLNARGDITVTTDVMRNCRNVSVGPDMSLFDMPRDKFRQHADIGSFLGKPKERGVLYRFTMFYDCVGPTTPIPYERVETGYNRGPMEAAMGTFLKIDGNGTAGDCGLLAFDEDGNILGMQCASTFTNDHSEYPHTCLVHPLDLPNATGPMGLPSIPDVCTHGLEIIGTLPNHDRVESLGNNKYRNTFAASDPVMIQAFGPPTRAPCDNGSYESLIVNLRKTNDVDFVPIDATICKSVCAHAFSEISKGFSYSLVGQPYLPDFHECIRHVPRNTASGIGIFIPAYGGMAVNCERISRSAGQTRKYAFFGSDGPDWFGDNWDLLMCGQFVMAYCIMNDIEFHLPSAMGQKPEVLKLQSDGRVRDARALFGSSTNQSVAGHVMFGLPGESLANSSKVAESLYGANVYDPSVCAMLALRNGINIGADVCGRMCIINGDYKGFDLDHPVQVKSEFETLMNNHYSTLPNGRFQDFVAWLRHEYYSRYGSRVVIHFGDTGMKPPDLQADRVRLVHRIREFESDIMVQAAATGLVEIKIECLSDVINALQIPLIAFNLAAFNNIPDNFDRVFRAKIIGSMIHSVMVSQKYVIRMFKRFCTGCIWTTLINIWFGMCYHRFAWVLAHGGDVASLEHYNEHVRASHYGDDNSAHLSDYAIEKWTVEHNLTDLLSTLGLTITSPEKDGPPRVSNTFNMLSRDLRWHENGHFVLALGEESIRKMIYHSEGRRDPSIEVQVLDRALAEISLRPEAEWAAKFCAIRSVMQRVFHTNPKFADRDSYVRWATKLTPLWGF